jgi:hypothetical protein
MLRSSTTTDDHGLLPNPHPGEILVEEFMHPLGLSPNALAQSACRPAGGAETLESLWPVLSFSLWLKAAVDRVDAQEEYEPPCIDGWVGKEVVM